MDETNTAPEPEAEQRRVIKLPTAAQARKLAKERGGYVEARDGKLYDGRSKEEVDKAVALTGRVFRVVKALRLLGAMPTTPGEYLDELPEYMENTLDEVFEPAVAWLEEFTELWRTRNEGGKLASINRCGDGPASQAEQAADPRGGA